MPKSSLTLTISLSLLFFFGGGGGGASLQVPTVKILILLEYKSDLFSLICLDYLSLWDKTALFHLVGVCMV